MDDALRHAWTKLITAADLDDHMHQVGQAAANAELLQSMLVSSANEKSVGLLIAGAGTAQFLDYIPATCLAPFRLTLSDINESFLKRANERCDRAGLSDVRFVVDDIEDTQLMGPYQVIAVALVLEHIDWRRGLRGIHRLAPDHLHIVIQCNPEGLVDTFVVGRMSTATVLGVYNVAAELATMLTIDLMQQISRGLYPNFAKLLHDRAKLIEAYMGAMSALATVSIAFGLGLWAVSHDIVRVVLGEKWLDAIPLLEWLAIGGTLRGIDFSLGTAILTVAGYERTSAVLMWMRLGLYTAGSIVGGMWSGQIGVAIGIVVASAIFIPVVILCLMLRFNLGILDFVRALWRPIPAGLAMIFLVRLLHPDSLSTPILRLFFDIIVGGLAFALALLALWHFSGRPAGIESRVLAAFLSKLKTIRS